MTTSIYENLPINTFITQLGNTKACPVTYDDLKEELSKKDVLGNKAYSLSLKEDDDLCMIYYNNNTNQSSNNETHMTELENSCRSIILDKQTLKPIVTQYNKILYNNDTIEFLKDKQWSQVIVQKCYEGTLIMVFYHNNKWYVTTRRCLDAQKSTWIKDKSYYDMFTEAMDGKFTFDELNKDYCYHFVLLHHKNRNIITYNWFGRDYKELLHILTAEKYSLNEIQCKINDKVKYVTDEKFNCLDDLLDSLTKLNELDGKYQRITTEGYVLKYYTGEIYKSPFITLKLQTTLYDTIMRLKPNNSNIDQCFLELYQQNRLSEFLPYFTEYGNDTKRRIHMSMQNMAKEILDLYHLTRNKKNSDIYNELTEQYKKCLYEIHGLYIQNRKEDFLLVSNKENKENKESLESNQLNENDIELKKGSVKSVNVYNVYNYLKTIQASELRQLYYDRITMINNEKFTFLNKNCINTLIQSTLMHKKK